MCFRCGGGWQTAVASLWWLVDACLAPAAPTCTLTCLSGVQAQEASGDTNVSNNLSGTSTGRLLANQFSSEIALEPPATCGSLGPLQASIDICQRWRPPKASEAPSETAETRQVRGREGFPPGALFGQRRLCGRRAPAVLLDMGWSILAPVCCDPKATCTEEG